MQLPPRLAWYSLLAAVVLVPLAVGIVPVAGVPLTLNVFVQAKLIVLALALAAGSASWALTTLRDGTVYSGRALIPVGVLLLVALLAAGTGIDPRIAFFGDSEQGVGVLVLLLCCLAAWLTTQLVRDDSRLTLLTSAVIFTATAVAGVGLLQQVLGIDLVGIDVTRLPAYVIRRGYGTIGNADTYAAYLVLPSLLALVRFVRSSTPRDRLRWGACFLVILTTAVAAQTRAPLLGMAVGGVLYAVAGRVMGRNAAGERGKRAGKTGTSSRTAAVISIAGVCAGVLIAAILAGRMDAGTLPDFVTRFGSLGSLLALGGRIPLWSAALKIAAAHPLLGIGPDSFRLGWYGVRQASHLATGVGLVVTDPHGLPLLLLATMGIPGLAAAFYVLGATLRTAYRTLSAVPPSKRGISSDYEAWACGLVALAVTLLASMVTSVLVFMLFLALGVLVAPALKKREPAGKPLGRQALMAGALLVGVALAAFGILTGIAQLTAVGARTDDAVLARARAARAASLAPWDTGLRQLEYETLVQAALDGVFTGKADAPRTVTEAEKRLEDAALAEPREYLHPYRSALLLIGAGQRLGKQYTQRGIEAGRRGLDIYPNSLELRTGIASGYLQLDQPEKAETALGGLWDADPAYLQAGLTYAEALAAQGKGEAARKVFTVLEERFPQDPALAELQKRISTN